MAWRGGLLTLMGALFPLIAAEAAELPRAPDGRFATFTASPAMVCQSSLAIRDAWKAVERKDPVWLKELGCIWADGGLEVVLTEQQPIKRYAEAYRARIYGIRGEGVTAYISSYSLMTWAYMGTFPDHGAAETEYQSALKTLPSKSQAAPIGHVVTERDNLFFLFLGPAPVEEINIACGAIMTTIVAKERQKIKHHCEPAIWSQ